MTKAQEAGADDLVLREDGREDDGDRHGDRGDDHQQQDRVLAGVDEVHVAGQRLEVLQSDEGLVAGEAAPLEERHTEHVERGNDHEDDEKNCGGQRPQDSEPRPFPFEYGLLALCRTSSR